MAIEDSVSLIAIIILYSPAVFTLNILLQVNGTFPRGTRSRHKSLRRRKFDEYIC